MTYGKQFKMIRVEKDMKIHQIESKSGVSKSVISKFENGGNITLKSLCKILKTVNHSVYFQ